MKTGIIGLGQCGTTIANEWSKINSSNYFATINTTAIDESKADNIKDKYLILNGDLGGMAKDRTQILSSIQRDKENFLSFIRSFIKNYKLENLILIASSGGGSGSGLVTEITKLLENKISLRCIVVAPSFSEGLSSLNNSLNVFTELQAYNTAIRIISNNNYRGIKSEIDKRGFINKYIISTEEAVLTASSKESLTNNLDSAEVNKLLFSKGFASIYTLPLKDDTELSNELIACLNSSFDVGLAQDRYFENLGLIYQGNTKTLASINEKKLDETIGIPLNKFSALFPSSDARIFMIISGGNMPDALEKYREETLVLTEKLGKQKFTNLKVENNFSNNKHEIEDFKNKIFINTIEPAIKIENKTINWLDDLDL